MHRTLIVARMKSRARTDLAALSESFGQTGMPRPMNALRRRIFEHRIPSSDLSGFGAIANLLRLDAATTQARAYVESVPSTNSQAVLRRAGGCAEQPAAGAP